MSADVNAIARDADVILDGYAFTEKGSGIAVLNLHRPEQAAFFSFAGELLETSMDDIELSIVKGYLDKARKYMEL